MNEYEIMFYKQGEKVVKIVKASSAQAARLKAKKEYNITIVLSIKKL